MKIRVYDPHGQEHWLSAGARVPAGWFQDDKPPKLLTEEHVVVEIDESNPYDEGGPIIQLRLRSISELEAERIAKEAEQIKFQEAERLTTVLHELGAPADSRVGFSLESGYYVTGAGIYHHDISNGEEDLRREIPEILRTYRVLEKQGRRAAAERAVCSIGERADHPAGRMVVCTGGWRSHGDSFGGLAGGDYGSDEEWQWFPWAKRAIARILAGEDAAVVCDEEIAADRDEDARRRQVINTIQEGINDGVVKVGSRTDFDQSIQCWMLYVGRHKIQWTPYSYMENPRSPRWFPDFSRADFMAFSTLVSRRIAAKARLNRMKKRANLCTLRLTQAEIEEALKSPEREAELREIAWVRSEWRGMESHVRKNNRGRLTTRVAIDLLYKIWKAQDRAVALRTAREQTARQIARAASASSVSPVHNEPEAKTAAPTAAAKTNTFGVGLAEAFEKLGI